MKMEGPYEASNKGEAVNHSLQIIKYSPYTFCNKLSPPWFHVRVFYVRVCRFQMDEHTPEFLSLSHVPLSTDTLLEVNGVRASMYSDGVSSVLRRDRVDKVSDEATFVNTDSIRLNGNVKFEVYDGEDCILSGVLEMLNCNGFNGVSRDNAKRWSMCCDSGTPIILTKALQLNFRRKYDRNCMLDAIPEYETAQCQKDVSDGVDLQVARYGSFKAEQEEDYDSMHWQRTRYVDDELSWFNAGVRVGVGVGLGICLGVGIGVGLLLRSYRLTTHNFMRRLK